MSRIGRRGQPRLTFFCELEADALQALFADSALMHDLAALNASLSLGILDLCPERAAVVRRLNEAGIPVIAWQLLPEEQGYWFNLGNAPQAQARYLDFKAWTAKHGLRWEGMGLDIEPDIGEVEQLLTNRWQLAPVVLLRVLDREGLHRAQAAYTALVAQMRADGYRVDSYHFPFIVDERRAGSTLLRRMAGLVDIPTDREVLCVYTSFLRPRGPGALWSYAPDAQSVGVGSTGGGVGVGGLADIPPLDWPEFSRDLHLARSWSDDIHIFSLEGCVAQDFLTGLKTFDWDQRGAPPLEMAKQVERLRRGLRAVLWASAHPFFILAGTIVLLWFVSRLLSTNGRQEQAERRAGCPEPPWSPTQVPDEPR